MYPKTISQAGIRRAYPFLTYDRPVFRDECGKKTKDGLIPFSKHQRFVSAFMSPRFPFGGLLLYHAAGTGKTCAAVSAMSHFLFSRDNEWRVVWVTRRTLKGAPLKAIFSDLCLPEVRSMFRDRKTELFGTKVPSKKIERLKEAFAKAKKNDPSMLVSFWRRTMKGFPKKNIVTYGEFARALAKSSSPEELFGRFGGDTSRRGRGSDPLRNVLVIIDEAHNLYNLTDFRDADFDTLHKRKYAVKTRGGERLNGLSVIEHAIWNSYHQSGESSCRVLPLTATPMPTDPINLISLLNLLIRSPSKRLPTDWSFWSKNGKIREKARNVFKKQANGIISFFSGDRDPRYFALKPFGKLVDVRITRIQGESIKRCERSGGKQKDNLECVRRAVTVAATKGKMCRADAYAGRDAVVHTLKRRYRHYRKKEIEKAREVHRKKENKHYRRWRDAGGKREDFKKKSFKKPHHGEKTKALANQIKEAKSKTLKCTTSFSFVLDATKGGKRFFTPHLLKESMGRYAPKYKSLLDTIDALDEKDRKVRGKLFKHCIYCDTSGPGDGRAYGSKFAASAFLSGGYVMGRPKGSGRHITFSPPTLKSKDALKWKKSFCVLSSSTILGDDKTEARTQATLTTFNAKENVHGKNLRFILIDDSFKEGIDLHDVRYFHMMEPPLSTASLKQAVARVTRRCGSTNLPYTRTGWNVDLILYRSVFKEKPLYAYEKKLIPKSVLEKQALTNAFETMAKETSIDYNLNKAVLNFSPPYFRDGIETIESLMK